MADTYSIKFNNGTTSFEVQGPSEAWVDGKVSELKILLETLLKEPPRNSDQISDGAQPKKATRRSSARSTTQKSEEPGTQLNDKWDEELAKALLDYVEHRKENFVKGPKQAAILAVFLKDEHQITAINPSDLELIYRKLGWKTIDHRSQLKNATARDKYFEKVSAGYQLTHAGLVFGRDTSKNKAA